MFAPLNGTLSDHAIWYPEPIHRGTFGILSSCLTTMLLCTWTAVHLNVPEQQGPFTKIMGIKRQTCRKIGWLLLGLLAPEIVAFTAYEQYSKAKSVLRRMRHGLKLETPTSYLQRLLYCFRRAPKMGDDPLFEAGTTPAVDRDINRPNVSWTMTQSFYAVMGGFLVPYDIPNSASPLLGTSTPSRFTLSEKGLDLIIEFAPEALLGITEQEINDKSKADSLGKGLVCLQAFWFCTQCVTRMSQSLTISLLELHVLVHAICALAVYALWWNKPFEVDQGTILTDSGDRKFDSIVAFMTLRDRSGPLHGGVWSTCQSSSEIFQSITPIQQTSPVPMSGMDISPGDRLYSFKFRGHVPRPWSARKHILPGDRTEEHRYLQSRIQNWRETLIQFLFPGLDRNINRF